MINNKYSLFGMIMVISTFGGVAYSMAQERIDPQTQRSTESGRAVTFAPIEEVIVTARRREENIQDVPISITIFNQEQIDNANMTNSMDLAAYTPSLAVNTRFGPENASFAIRGFTQDLRTTASVAVYFAEVVAPRGQSGQTSGDGAGPGSLFDLQNVQVLKGPQGTLFGRNTTGGAILLTPNPPGYEFEGHIEISQGDFDALRGQAVVDLPLVESFRLRLGIDKNRRDGTLNNITNIGAKELGDVDYTAGRLSMVWDVTDSVENYSIFSMVNSESNGYTSQLFDCNNPIPRLTDPDSYDLEALIQGIPGLISGEIDPLDPIPGVPLGSPFALLTAEPCEQQLKNQRASGQDGFYDIVSTLKTPITEFKERRFINTTTWEISDNLTAKATLAYAHLLTENGSNIFGNYFPDFSDSSGRRELTIGISVVNPDIPVTSQETWVGEVQLQGSSFSDRLVWQTGIYHENSKPDGFSGNNSASLIYCDVATLEGAPSQYDCNDPLNGLLGGVLNWRVKTEYLNQAVYAQGTYLIFEPLSVTLGVRYTRDETEGLGIKEQYQYNLTEQQAPVITVQTPGIKSAEPTGVLEFIYHPRYELMTYAKYSRGYRQGNVNMLADPGLDTHDPETIDTYEIGLKSSFDWPVSGRFNIAAFSNTLTDMQLQGGYISTTSGPTTAIFNAGKATSRGIEVEAMVRPFRSLSASLSYSYLDTELKESADFCGRVQQVGFLEGFSCTPIAEVGDELPFAPKSSYIINLDWTLPLPPSLGLMSLGATYAYTGKQRAAASSSSPHAVMDEFALLNVNFTWIEIFGQSFDLSVFGTNIRDKEYTTYVSGTFRTLGIESRSVGLPRMIGARLRYNF